MGWMQQLVETYDNVSCQGAFAEPDHPLIEAGFIEKRASVIVTLDADGNFREAERLEKDAGDMIVIPTTPEAESRTSSKLPPYPLFDQLVYLAGEGYKGKDAALHGEYVAALAQWAAEPDAPEMLKIFSRYIAGGSLIRDLRASGFAVDPDKDAKQLYCFRILTRDGSNDRFWQRPEVVASWRRRSVETRGNVQLCCVEGVAGPILENHPKLLGNGKLISAQDTGTIFQYKGRFTAQDEATAVSYDASVKANNTLLWLLKRQGFNRYGMQVVAWTSGGDRVSLPIQDEGSELAADAWEESTEDAPAEQITTPQTLREYGERMRRELDGYRQDMTGYKQSALDALTILALTAATPGRISVTYYQEMTGDAYVARLGRWYEECAWGFARFAKGKDDHRLLRGVGTPTPLEIAMTVYGKRQADTARGDMRNEKSATKVIRELKLRLLRCMAEGSDLPRDLLLAAFHRVCTPQSFTDDKGKWQSHDWNLALSTYCALLRRQQCEMLRRKPNENEERVMDVSLDTTCTDRSYLYGRLLAVLDKAERRALRGDGNGSKTAYRETNAFRYMTLFQQRPFTTYAKVHALATPYLAKLRESAGWYKAETEKIMNLFEGEDFASNQPLSGTFLQGFYCERSNYSAKEGVKPGELEDAEDETND